MMLIDEKFIVSKIPQKVMDIMEFLESKGVYYKLVGGSLRDLVTGREPKDWDIFIDVATSKDIDKISKSIANYFSGTEGNAELTTLGGDFYEDITEDYKFEDVNIQFCYEFDLDSKLSNLIANSSEICYDIKNGLKWSSNFEESFIEKEVIIIDSCCVKNSNRVRTYFNRMKTYYPTHLIMIVDGIHNMYGVLLEDWWK